MTAQLQGFLNFVALHPTLAIAAAFLLSAGEAPPIIGLFSPSTVVLVGIGGLVGLGKASFWPVFIATILGAVIGDASTRLACVRTQIFDAKVSIRIWERLMSQRV